jgi:anti-anti-sigma factor
MLNHFLEGDTLVIPFLGRMDSRITLELEPLLVDKFNRISCKKIIFDLKDVDFVASAFLRICVTTAQKVGEANFSVINTRPQIKKTFKIAGLDQFLQVS